MPQLPEPRSDFQTALLHWFSAHQRDLPWRRSYAPYEVWISEIMLQQTQMDRAVGYFQRWLHRFPDIRSVAAASEDELLTYWEGLGYYNRARNIHKTARILVQEHAGGFPRTRHELLALPGIGPYTAGAVLSIGFGQDEPAIDANVERILARLTDIDTPVKTKPAQQAIQNAARALLPPGRCREFNQALMELGGMICRARTPGCVACPVAGFCEAHRLGITDQRPVPGKRPTITPLEIVAGVLVHQGRLFIQKRRSDSVWANLWEFPGGRVETGEAPEQAVVREFGEETEFTVRVADKITVIRHGYTTYKVTLHCFFCTLENRGQTLPKPVLHAAQEARWATPDTLGAYAFPAAHRKLIDTMQRDLRLTALLGT
ncbi:MAG: A/G-specific adenine glycosylase [Thermodesulfobacteriota bacterium]